MNLTLSIDLNSEEIKEAITRYILEKKVAARFRVKELEFLDEDGDELDVTSMSIRLDVVELGDQQPNPPGTPIAANGIEAIRAKM